MSDAPQAGFHRLTLPSAYMDALRAPLSSEPPRFDIGTQESLALQSLQVNFPDAQLLTSRGEIGARMDYDRWREVLAKRFRFDPHEAANGALLMMSLSAGLQAVTEYHRQNGQPDFITPYLYFYRASAPETGKSSTAAAARVGQHVLVLVNIDNLHKQAGVKDVGDSGYFWPPDIEHRFSMLGMWLSHGVQEGDHGAYTTNPARRQRIPAPDLTLSRAAYDAREEEYHWLETALLLPIVQQRPDLYAAIASRLAAADNWRRSHSD